MQLLKRSTVKRRKSAATAASSIQITAASFPINTSHSRRTVIHEGEIHTFNKDGSITILKEEL